MLARSLLPSLIATQPNLLEYLFPDMELYATGFNAWRQLEFNHSDDYSKEPDDFKSFRSVLKDSCIDRPYASLAFTLGKPGVLQHLRKGDTYC